MAWTPQFELYGVNGSRIQDEWAVWPTCYLGIAAPGFPNYWVMNGPRGSLANGTVLPCLETHIEYVIAAAKKIQSDRIRAIEVRRDITEQLGSYIDKWHEGSSVHYLKTIKYPRWEHYNFRYIDDNPWAFLGSGRTKGETESDFEALTSYIRNADVTWDIV
ncbi:putative sterigmatocystin biosynthesis monooxygenase stcW [Aspergillus awamori]|uniref:Putative sterigmatocystin biosynthesis monooxygenase stcW n=1 Tax=Aspergillus awamori TaxID=105351 RepID=A0A401KYM6_ASPAW|nr:putative sterigmatocystin biosynthesis monooxygenase stcW [Aspergillus awamori]